MKKNSVLYLLLILFSTFIINAQDTLTHRKNYKYNNNFDVALSASANQQMGALSWVHFHSVTKKQRFKIGYGIRFNSQFGKNLTYVTAPASITSKRNDPGVLFSKIYYENIDTFFVAKSQNNSLNLSINLQYTIKQKLDIGFNIDAIGFSFGAKTTGIYISSQSTESGSTQSARPTPFNLLLVSDNDIGFLNSELYVRYWFNKNWGIKAGASFIFTEYTTDNKLRLDNNRWRNKALIGMIGITYSPFR